MTADRTAESGAGNSLDLAAEPKTGSGSAALNVQTASATAP